ncbi:MAG TPA: RidA family protein [Gemmatimonadaceae bacterium]|jgi:enamine deaminase RidA (YjgF/YER057c/UK114 family)|nr:RidA family protein [Gemmatimonadaceae bacterium]
MNTPINPRELGSPRGYSNGMLAPPGRMLAIAGQIGWDGAGKLVSDEFAQQFNRALGNVLAVLHEAGGVPSDLITLRIYVVDKQRYLAQTKEIGAIYRELMGGHYPAMALVQVADLLEPGAQVEIEGLAVIS